MKDTPKTIAMTAVERKSFPRTKNDVKPNKSRKPPRTVITTALPISLTYYKEHSHLSLVIQFHDVVDRRKRRNDC
jgi:hypothetical protein